MIRPGSPTAARRAADGRTTRLLHEEHLFGLAAADRLTGPAKVRYTDLVPQTIQRFDTVGGVGVASIRPHGDGTYELAEIGIGALIFAVRDLPASLGGSLLDLVAYLPKTGEVYRRLGASDLLGAWHAAPPAEDSVRVFSSPVEWARAGAVGVVVLAWDRVPLAIGHARRLVAVADDPAVAVALGRRLRDALVPSAPRLPRILVETSKHEVAA